MMAVLASGTWWLVRNAPSVDTPREAAPLRHEPDYTMTRFVVQRFGSDGALRTEIEGERLRHYPDDDTLEIDQARIRAIGDRRRRHDRDCPQGARQRRRQRGAAARRCARRPARRTARKSRSSSAASSCMRSATSSACARTCRWSSRRARASFAPTAWSTTTCRASSSSRVGRARPSRRRAGRRQ